MSIQAKDTANANECALSHPRGNHKLPWCSSKPSNKRAHTAYLIPSHWLRSEERTGQLNRKPFLIILGLVLRHSEQNSSCICCWERKKKGPWGKAEAALYTSSRLTSVLLTHTLIPRMKELCQRSCGSLRFDSFCRFLVLSKLTEDPCSYSLDIFNRRIKQLRRKHTWKLIKSKVKTWQAPRCGINSPSSQCKWYLCHLY